METVSSADGTSIAYERTGSGPPLVLVHGTTADHTRWEPVLPGFEEHFAVYAMDRRGRGESGDADEYDLEREYEDAVAVVEAAVEESGEPAVLLGHSFGASCALEAALRIDALRALVLYEPAIEVGEHGFYSEGVVRTMEAHLDAGEDEAALLAFFGEVADFSPEELDALRSAPNWPDRVEAAYTAVRETRAEHAYAFDPARFADATVPALLLSGSESPAFLRAATAAVADALPDATVVTLEGHGHVAQNTAPELFVEEVVAFVDETG